MGIAKKCLKYLDSPNKKNLIKQTEIRSSLQPDWRDSKKLGLKYKLMHNGEVVFEDETIYKPEEISFLKKYPHASAENLQFLHKIKVAFPGAIISERTDT